MDFLPDSQGHSGPRNADDLQNGFYVPPIQGCACDQNLNTL